MLLVVDEEDVTGDTLDVVEIQHRLMVLKIVVNVPHQLCYLRPHPVLCREALERHSCVRRERKTLELLVNENLLTLSLERHSCVRRERKALELLVNHNLLALLDGL